MEDRLQSLIGTAAGSSALDKDNPLVVRPKIIVNVGEIGALRAAPVVEDRLFDGHLLADLGALDLPEVVSLELGDFFHKSRYQNYKQTKFITKKVRGFGRSQLCGLSGVIGFSALNHVVIRVVSEHKRITVYRSGLCTDAVPGTFSTARQVSGYRAANQKVPRGTRRKKK